MRTATAYFGHKGPPWQAIDWPQFYSAAVRRRPNRPAAFVGTLPAIPLSSSPMIWGSRSLVASKTVHEATMTQSCSRPVKWH